MTDRQTHAVHRAVVVLWRRPRLRRYAGRTLCALLLAGTSGLALAADPAQLPAQGEGFVEAVPDIVVVDLTISHTGKTLSEAKQEVDRVSSAVIRAAAANGIKSDDLQASKIQAAPDYDWQNGARSLRGQQVTRTFQLRLRDIERYGVLIQALADAQVTQLNGIRTEFSKQEQLDNDALKNAIANVRTKADAMAAACNGHIKTVLSLTEGGLGNNPAPLEMRADFAKVATAASPGDAGLSIGKQRIVKTVSAVFELAPNP